MVPVFSYLSARCRVVGAISIYVLIFAAVLVCTMTVHTAPARAGSPDPVLGGVFYVPSAYIVSGYGYRKIGDRESMKYMQVLQGGYLEMSLNKDLSGNMPSDSAETSMKLKIFGRYPYGLSCAVGSANFSRGDEYRTFYLVSSMYLSSIGTRLHIGGEQHKTGPNLDRKTELMLAVEQRLFSHVFLLCEQYRGTFHGGIRISPFPGVRADFIWEDLESRESFKDVGIAISLISLY